MIRQKCQNILLILAFLCVLAVLPILTYFLIDNHPREIKKSLTPTINVALNNASIQDINEYKDTAFTENSLFISDGTIINNIEMHGHGNSSWGQPKKSYTFELERAQSILGLKNSTKYVAISNYLDDSSMRNDVAFYLEEILGMEYSRKGLFFELSVNDEYQGLYYLVPRIEIGKNDIALSDESAILVEADNLWSDKNNCFYSWLSSCLTLKGSLSKTDSKALMNQFKDEYSKFEHAIYEKDYETINNIVDIESTAKYFILSEFTVNPDAYNSSFYMFKNGANDKIHFGPGWDFDYAFGNRNWDFDECNNSYSPVSYLALSICAAPYNDIFYKMVQIPEFQKQVKRVFNEKLSGKASELLLYMMSTKNSIADAVGRDGAKWGKNSFDSEFDYLFDWVAQRYLFLESIYAD